MSENAGAAVLSLGLALVGFGCIVAGIRGTYPAVWAALKVPAASLAVGAGAGAGIGTTGTTSGGGSQTVR